MWLQKKNTDGRLPGGEAPPWAVMRCSTSSEEEVASRSDDGGGISKNPEGKQPSRPTIMKTVAGQNGDGRDSEPPFFRW